MTNETSYAPIKYVCNGVSVDFTFPWKIFEEKDLIVHAQGESGLLRELTLGVDYSVEFDEVGGNVKLNQTYAEGDLVIISRNVSDYQSKSFSTSSGFQASEIEESLDKVSCNLQEMEYNIENFKEVFSQTVNQEIDVLEGVIEENKQEVLVIQERFEDEVNTKIQEVSEAAGKINALEQAVLDAQASADNAQASADEALAQKEDLIIQGEKLVEDVSKEVARVEDAVEELDKNIDKIVNHSQYNMFDMIITDHILEGKEAINKVLQGTYVYKNGGTDRIGYPDFYNKCLEEKNSATATEATLADSTLTIFVNSNGHQFFNISDKSIVDTFYEAYGIADFYGIDEENERIFLPRNKYFAVKGSVSVAGNGMTLGLTNGTKNYGLQSMGYTPNANINPLNMSSSVYGTPVNTNMGTAEYTNKTLGVAIDPTKSGLGGQLQPNENRYLYYCVGNTQVTSAVTNVTEITTSENDTLPWGYNFYSGDLLEAPVGYVESLGQWNRGQEWQSFYDRAVAKIGQPFASGYIKERTEEYDDFDLVINQDEMTFRLPLLNGEENVVSDKYEDWELKASVSNYTAPANGMIQLTKRAGTADAYITMWSDLNGQQLNNSCPTSGGSVSATMTLTKGETFNVGYSASGDTVRFRFIYFKGNGNLYFKLSNAVQNLELLNVGKVMDGLADKISRQDCKAYITETYKNGSSWYRVWSDGWCEQGGMDSTGTGTKTITFLKPFRDTNYAPIATSRSASLTASDSVNIGETKTATSMTLTKGNTVAYWQASGCIA